MLFHFSSGNWVVCKCLRLEKSLARCFAKGGISAGKSVRGFNEKRQ